MKTMLILILLANGQWSSHEVEARSCERTASQVAQRLEQKEEITAVWTACVTRYKA